MRSRPRRVALAIPCLLAGLVVAACGSPTVHGTGVSYTCCSDSVVSTTWHPGHPLPVTWTRTRTVPQGEGFQPVTLSAVLTGPYKDVTALKAGVSKGQLNRSAGWITAVAPDLQITRNPPRSPVSVITIPANAPPGFYNLQVTIAFGQGGGTESGDSIVTVG